MAQRLAALYSLLYSTRRLALRFDLTCLKLANRFSRRRVTSPKGPVVSLATYGKRLETAYLAVESIARGSMRPTRMLLWLDDPRQLASLPVELRRLQARGLEIKLSDRNYGPHKKYYPYLLSRKQESLAGADGPLVTADDDVLYPRYWLQRLSKAHWQAPDLVQCYRARVVEMSGGTMAPYATWKLCRSSEPSFRTFAIGVSGILYPAPLLDLLSGAGRQFETICPRADDLWLHLNAIRRGYRIRQLSNEPVHFPIIPDTQEGALQQQNLQNGGNDVQAKNAYTPEDLRILQFDSLEPVPCRIDFDRACRLERSPGCQS